MFDFFKKKALAPAPNSDRLPFITQLFDKVRLQSTPEKRLEGYIDLWEIILNLEHEFDVRCLELELERDEIRDAFHECNDPSSLYTCAIAYGILRDKVDIITRDYYQNLPSHLKARLLRTHIISELDEIYVDLKELDPTLQHAFYDVERRSLNEFEKAHILETEFGIKGWRSTREMNPHIIYD